MSAAHAKAAEQVAMGSAHAYAAVLAYQGAKSVCLLQQTQVALFS